MQSVRELKALFILDVIIFQLTAVLQRCCRHGEGSMVEYFIA